MKTALRREVEAAGWRALGFLLALGAVVLGTVLWGQHIEGRIDSVVTERQHDHRVLRELVHEAHPVEFQANSKSLQNLDQGGEAQRRPAAGAPGEGSAPKGHEPVAHNHPEPHSPSGHGGTAPQPEQPSSPEGEAAPTTAPTSTTPEATPPPVTTPSPPGPPPSVPAVPLVPKALEAVEQAGKQVGGVVDQAGCEVGGVLGGRCP